MSPPPDVVGPLAVAAVLFGSVSQISVPTLASRVQVAEQQSPLAVLPSSHCSVPTTTPSPQTPVQTEGVPVHA